MKHIHMGMSRAMTPFCPFFCRNDHKLSAFSLSMVNLNLLISEHLKICDENVWNLTHLNIIALTLTYLLFIFTLKHECIVYWYVFFYYITKKLSNLSRCAFDQNIGRMEMTKLPVMNQ